MALTRKQAEILAWIREFIADRGFAPTLEEIAEAFSVTSVTIFEHVRQLERKGAIRTEKNRARSIELIEDERVAESWSTVPILGRIAAGPPIEAVENPEAFDVRDLLAGGREDCFLLEVTGRSMIEEHIQDGDLVVVERRDTARMGEMVVALIRGEETTLKKYYPEADRVRLEPANAAMEPIIVSRSDVVIQGVVRGVIRRY